MKQTYQNRAIPFRVHNVTNRELFVLIIICNIAVIYCLGLYGTMHTDVLMYPPTNNAIKTNISDNPYQNYQWTKIYCLTATKKQNGVECIPEYRCKKKVQYREWNVCLDDLVLDNCLVYSVGVDRDWHFDEMMGALGCEVHSFDPTITLPTNLAPNVTFHKIGVRGPNNTVGVATNFTHSLYGEIEGEMLTFAQIINKLGHKNRQITLLKMDCEGCEWEAFSDKESQKLLCGIPQLLVELHFSKTIGIPSLTQIPLITNFYDFITTCKFHRFYSGTNMGFHVDQHVLIEFLLYAMYTPPNACCKINGFMKLSKFLNTTQSTETI